MSTYSVCHSIPFGVILTLLLDWIKICTKKTTITSYIFVSNSRIVIKLSSIIIAYIVDGCRIKLRVVPSQFLTNILMTNIVYY